MGLIKKGEVRGWLGLPQYSKDMYITRYFLEGETYTEWCERVAGAYCVDEAHKKRVISYLANYWFHPSTPISSSAGVPKERGLPIACYTNSVPDTKKGIFDTFSENNWLGAFGGGIGTTWSNVRSIGEEVGKEGGESSGIIPFYKVSDSSTLAVSQGGRRRASQAVYLEISHPEIFEHIDIRRPTGDTDRRSTHLHHGVVIPDAFMEAVASRGMWELKSPKTERVIDVVDAFDLWKKILLSRMETGEPYILFSDNVNRANPIEYKERGYEVETSNLCSEIMLHTSEDKTGVCCLTSINLEYWDEYKDNEEFFRDIYLFTDRVLQSFIDLTEGKEGFEKARKAAMEERSIGIGVMGYAGMLQQKMLPYNSIAARAQTNLVFKRFSEMLEKAKRDTGGTNFHLSAIAPTASISILCNMATAGIDSRLKNVYVEKTDIGTYTITNKYLEKYIREYAREHEKSQEWIEEQWDIIKLAEGSVLGLDWMPQEDKEVFLTSFEIDPRAVIASVSIMTPHVTQGISCNLFLLPDINVRLLHELHMKAWKEGLKSLYYVRSRSVKRAAIGDVERVDLSMETDTCIGCT